jgi:MarR-like DNA-binding transcriptional regulator SgrR of sgrS sRNA
VDSRVSITNTFRNVVEKRNRYQCKIRRRHPKPMLASLLCPVQYIISMKDSEGSMLVSPHASTVYAV